MWRMVLDDLRYGAKPGLKQMFRQFGSWYLYFYMLFIAPMIFHLENKHLLVYYFAFLPMFLALMLSRMYAGRANKVLHLCPLSRGERKRYWLISWGIRTGAPVLLSLLLNGILLLLEIFSLPAFAVIVITNMLYSAAMNLYCQPVKDATRFAEQRYPLPGHYEVWNAAVQISGLLTIVFVTAVVGDFQEPRYSTTGEIVVSLLMFFCHTLLAFLMIVKYFRPVMEHAVTYEDMVLSR